MGKTSLVWVVLILELGISSGGGVLTPVQTRIELKINVIVLVIIRIIENDSFIVVALFKETLQMVKISIQNNDNSE